MANILTTISASVLAVILYALYHEFISPAARRRKRLPPGPPGVPFLGNTDFPTVNAHKKFKEWADQYGEIYSLRLGSTNFVILNSDKVIKELMDSRGNIYSSRPYLYVASEIIHNGNSILMQPYAERWRHNRKVLHSLLGVQASNRFRPYQNYESLQMLNDLLSTPQDFYTHSQRYATSVIISSVYGLRAPNYSHPVIEGIFRVLRIMGQVSQPGNFWVDTYPGLDYLPDAVSPWRIRARKMHELEKKMWKVLWNPLKNKAIEGYAPECFANGLFKLVEKGEMDEEQAYYMAGGLLAAGSESTSATFNSMLLCAVAYPHVVTKAQEELERVIGPNRLPNFTDEPNLPCIRSIIKETQRYRPVAPQGFPHATSKDDQYQGYLIPAGTVVLANNYSVHFDSKRHPNPEVFDPERWMDEKWDISAAEAAAQKDPTRRDHFAYGVGRRICPGIHVAENSLFLLVSRVLWGFNITNEIVDGKKVEVDVNRYAGGGLAKPDLFKAKIEPRSEKHKEIMMKEWKGSESVLGTLGDVDKRDLGELDRMYSEIFPSR